MEHNDCTSGPFERFDEGGFGCHFFFYIIPFLLGLWNQSWLDPAKHQGDHRPAFSLGPRRSENLSAPRRDRLLDFRQAWAPGETMPQGSRATCTQVTLPPDSPSVMTHRNDHRDPTRQCPWTWRPSSPPGRAQSRLRGAGG